MSSVFWPLTIYFSSTQCTNIDNRSKEIKSYSYVLKCFPWFHFSVSDHISLCAPLVEHLQHNTVDFECMSAGCFDLPSVHYFCSIIHRSLPSMQLRWIVFIFHFHLLFRLKAHKIICTLSLYQFTLKPHQGCVCFIHKNPFKGLFFFFYMFKF